MLDTNFGGGENYQCVTTSILIGSETFYFYIALMAGFFLSFMESLVTMNWFYTAKVA